MVACSEQPKAPPVQMSELKPGGALTSKRLSERSYIYPGPGLTGKQQLDFWTGFSLFRDPWVIAPSSTKDRDGLGPLFSTRSCISCHLGGARGHQAEEGISAPSAMIVRIGPRFQKSDYSDIHYGGQIQPRYIKITHPSIQNELKGEAKIELSYQNIKGIYSDGSEYWLRKPTFKLVEKAYGELSEGSAPSYRLAPAIYGLGLLDAIDESDLLKMEDVGDADGDGISPAYNRVVNVKTGKTKLGRFGLKGNHPTLEQQVAAAFRDDIGITNSLFPTESCLAHQLGCRQAASIDGSTDVEIPEKLLRLVNTFSLGVAVPPARQLDSEKVLAGRELFYAAQCQHCHTPSYRTNESYPIKALAGQQIWPYTDLALHDMGAELGEDAWEKNANPREWRTPPLWGLGLRQKYQKDAVFLHDGRARNITEAILWHGGEAEMSQQYFINLSQVERQQLVAFLKAI